MSEASPPEEGGTTRSAHRSEIEELSMLDTLKAALLFMTRTVDLLVGRSSPSVDMNSEKLLRDLVASDSPSKLLSAEVGSKSTAIIVRCRFVRDSNLDACTLWIVAKIRT